MGLSVWRETSKKLTVYRVCYTPIETLIKLFPVKSLSAGNIAKSLTSEGNSALLYANVVRRPRLHVNRA